MSLAAEAQGFARVAAGECQVNARIVLAIKQTEQRSNRFGRSAFNVEMAIVEAADEVGERGARCSWRRRLFQLLERGGIQRDQVHLLGAARPAQVGVILFRGGFQLLGTSNSVHDTLPMHRGGYDWMFMRINLDGSKRNSRWYGGSADDFTGNTIVMNYPGYIAAGSTFSSDKDVTQNHGMSDVWVVRYGGVAE